MCRRPDFPRCFGDIPTGLKNRVANSGRAETIAEADIAPAMMLAMRLAGHETGEPRQRLQPGAGPTGPRQANREIIPRMFVEAPYRAETGDDKVKQNIGTRSNERQRHKIGQGNLKKEIRRTHVAGADGFARAGRVMHAVSELTDQARPMQDKAVENILDNVVSDAHEH